MNANSNINVTPWYEAIQQSIAFMTSFSYYQSGSADVPLGNAPKDWPANQAKHQIVVHRKSSDKGKAAMILPIPPETSPQSKEAMRQAMSAVDCDEPQSLVKPNDNNMQSLAKPNDNNMMADWWCKQALGICIPCATTKDAATYFPNLFEN